MQNKFSLRKRIGLLKDILTHNVFTDQKFRYPYKSFSFALKNISNKVL